ncbi:M48 family metallopeptidase [Legionella cardiaca]|uniref:SprT family zinc-dependent metalloprotease n=1 Tax=Legionella cardiaca TaxID=1071983 RepID=A0ABY8APR4_9GAMM|nr:SprT family zinc-dependent metalloprotease [Legionella cardiaca]WED42533.1 SprT family zinc-dependent metalloprotease [Legionella cardiaca]
MVKHKLEIDGILVEILRKPIKNMHLRVYPPDGQVKVSAPIRFRLETIRQQLETKLDWIHAQRKRLKTQPLLLKTGEICHFLGNAYTLLVVEGTSRASVSIEKHVIRCHIKENSTFEERNQLLQAWYRQEMKKLLPPLISKWEPIINVRVYAWGIKTMKTRWGSCNIRAHRIWLNLRLMKKPLSCLEYVLVHEMIHLLEANHNKQFYSLMDKFLPDWRQQQNLLET